MQLVFCYSIFFLLKEILQIIEYTEKLITYFEDQELEVATVEDLEN